MNCPACYHLNPPETRFCGRCGTALKAPEPASSVASSSARLVGAELADGRYYVLQELGAGGMGTVYRAVDRRIKREVALKVLHPELTGHPTARRRMVQEAEALARMESPNVVRVFDVFDEGALLIIVLELVTGGDLTTVLKGGGIGESEAVRLCRGILVGLQAIHEAGLVHRDIKPNNILLTATGIPKVTDLGVARDSQARERTQLGASLGTPEYMSPEQVQGVVVDARSDVYAVGLVLFELLTGRSPFDGTSDFDFRTAHVRSAPRLQLLDGRASAATIRVIAKALMKEPGERFGSAAEMLRALEGPASGHASPVDALPQVRVASNNPGNWPMAAPVEPIAVHPPTNVVKVSPGSFSFDGRVTRTNYLLYSIGGALGFGFVGGLLGALAVPLGVIVFAVGSIYVISLSVRRAHDVDVTGLVVLLGAIPYLGFLVGLYLLLAPGTAGPNRFGPNPRSA